MRQLTRFGRSRRFPAYLVAIRAIIGDRVGYLLAAAFPAVLPNFIVGQNGFLTASLIGGALVLLEGNPIASGILLGLLTYKPHLGTPVSDRARGRRLLARVLHRSARRHR